MRWYTRIAYALMWFVARLPVRVLRMVGVLAGSMFWLTRSRKRRIVEANLSLVCANLDPPSRRRLARECVRESGIAMADALGVWTHPRRTLARVREVHGQALFDDAVAAKRGLILCAPHLGSWEAGSTWVAARTPFATLFTPPRHREAEALLRRLRGANVQFPADASGVRRLIRHLRDGGVVSILSDHVPRTGGVVAPFFGVPAFTMTLLPRLAARTGAAVLVIFVERIPGATGYRVHVRAAPTTVADVEPRVGCAAMNAAIEACVRDAFTQYQWNYKRFKPRPGSGLADDAYAAAGVPS